jgi:hypothetical protein
MKMYNYAVDKFRGTWIHDVFKKVRSLKRRVMRRSDGERYLLEKYRRLHGKHLNVTNPQTFTEKLFCRMISWNRGHDPIFTELADKYAARAYVSDKVGEQHLVKLLWHGTDPRAIPFDTLPAEYVIKTNHGSRSNIIIKENPDRLDIISRLSDWLNSNYYWSDREYQYYHITPKIMIEECLGNQDGSLPLDYKFWCFKGEPVVIQVLNHTRDINNFFDTQWNQLDLYTREGKSRPAIAKPKNLEQMLSIASRLSEGFDFVRIDLYNLHGKIYFGEFTFTPTAGLMKPPESWDLKLGEKWVMQSET